MGVISFKGVKLGGKKTEFILNKIFMNFKKCASSAR
jgi:hypothetical protein